MLIDDREMVNYLYSKLVYEEKQRLATEEQAHLMISTMEKSVLQMVLFISIENECTNQSSIIRKDV